MLSKLLSFLAQAKGAAIATVVVAGAATATVGATSPEVQDTLHEITATIAGQSPAPSARTTSGASCTDEDGDTGGQPAVVAQRNAADKLLRDAYTDDHKKLEDMRGGPGRDNKAVGEVVRTYDDQLRDTLNIALNRVAALTLGRDGQVRKADASASAAAAARASGSAKPESAKPSESARGEASKSPKPSCSPKPSASARSASASESPRPSGSARTSEASESPRASGSAKPSDQGRVAVADRTTLDPDIRAIVDHAITDMAALVQKAADEVAKLPAPDRGKSSDDHGNKPDNGAKQSENPGGRNKSTATPSPKR